MTDTIEQIDEIIDKFAKQGITIPKEEQVTYVVTAYKPVFYDIELKDTRNIKFIKKEEE